MEVFFRFSQRGRKARPILGGVGLPECTRCRKKISVEEDKENKGLCDGCEGRLNHFGKSGKDFSEPVMVSDREYHYEEGLDPHDGLEGM